MIRGLARVGLVVCGAALIAGCGGSAPTRVASPGPPPVTVPLGTSLVTAQGTWAIAVMGGSAASHNNFWQLFLRPAGASRWALVTPPGVADNGGLVAAGGTTSLVVGLRPSQKLAFSPLATSTDAGRNWTPGLLDATLADTPGAIAVGPSGRTLALLQDGSIEAAGPAAAGSVRALGFGAGGSAWLLLNGGRAETVGGTGGSWRALPPVPPGTVTLATEGSGSYDALAVAGATLTVWRLAHGAWAKVQQITVPIQYGSSG